MRKFTRQKSGNAPIADIKANGFNHERDPSPTSEAAMNFGKATLAGTVLNESQKANLRGLT
jgi:hypothetical protein